MAPISVGGYNIGMLPVRKSFCQFAANSIRFLRRNLTRLKGLSYMIGKHIVFGAPSPCDSQILPPHQHKLRFRRLRCAAIACHQYAVFGFHRVFDVAERAFNRIPSSLSLADM